MKLKLALTTPLIVLPFIAQAETPAITRFDTTITNMRSIQKKLESDAQEAKSDKDSIKLVCISDRLRTVAGTIEQALTRKEPLEAAISTGDTEGTEHNLTIVKELHHHATTAAAEADLCLGVEVIRNNEEHVKYEVSDDIAQPDINFPTPPAITEPPACASCYR